MMDIKKKALPGFAALAAYAFISAALVIEGKLFFAVFAALLPSLFIVTGLRSRDRRAPAMPMALNGPGPRIWPVAKSPYFLLLGLALTVTALNIYAPAGPSILERAAASFIMAAGFLPAFLYMRNREHGIPFLPLFGIIYSVYYALPLFLLKGYSVRDGWLPTPQESMDKSLLLSAAGLVMLLLAFYKIPGGSIGKHLPRIAISWDPQKAKVWGVIFFLVGSAVNFLSNGIIPVRYASTVNFISQLAMLGIGILYILQLRGHLGLAGKIALWGFFLPLIFLIRLATGSLAQILLIFVFLILTSWYFKKKIPWKLMTAGLLLFLFFYNARNEFRYLTWGGEYEHDNPIEKSLIFTKLAFAGAGSYGKEYEAVSARTSLVLPFAYVVEMTPERIPYWMGSTYLSLLWMPLPRILFPWKPEKTLGQQFGHRYGLLDPSDTVTSFNFPQLIEMYADFGTTGVIIGMLLMGTIYRAIYEMLCHSDAGEGGFLIGLLIFTGLSNIESDFSLVFGNIIYDIALFAILVRFLKNRHRPQ
ncbi:MAG: hypothetical protein M0Z61_05190 [Nitrospiraceae bacterium]|nr:hypothetical protein [Nitrospiraceae bacterium]